MPVFCRGNDTCRFVQHIVFILRIGNSLPKIGDLILFCIDPGSGIFADGSVDKHLPFGNVLFYLGSCPESHIRKIFIQS